MDYHLIVLLLVGFDVSSMPVNIPILTDLDFKHFFIVDLINLCSLAVCCNVLIKFNNWSIVHQTCSVGGNVYAELKMSARLSSSELTTVLNIVHHQCTVMDDFSHCSYIVDIFIVFEILDVSAVNFSKH